MDETMSETAKYRHLVIDYCNGCGADIGCGREKIRPEAIGVDLIPAKYRIYASEPRSPVACIEIDGTSLPFVDVSLDYLFSSHLLEDFADWMPLLREWWRVLKRGGHLVVIIPDHEMFRAAVRRGQEDNLNHHHEGRVGELSEHIRRLGPCEIIRDSMSGISADDYSIVCVAVKR